MDVPSAVAVGLFGELFWLAGLFAVARLLLRQAVLANFKGVLLNSFAGVRGLAEILFVPVLQRGEIWHE